MSDQADGLRELIKTRAGVSAFANPNDDQGFSNVKSRSQTLVFTSGKGGVGTSNVLLNLAIALSEIDQRVVLIDADLGLANIDLLVGLNPSCDLGDVLLGERTAADALVPGPAGLKILPGVHAMRTVCKGLGESPPQLLRELTELEYDFDYRLIDAGSGIGQRIAQLASAADEVVVVTTPEPTSIADSHAAIATLKKLPEVRLRVLVNQAKSVAEANEVMAKVCVLRRQFHGAVVMPFGHVRADPHVPLAVRACRPFVLMYPGSIASRGIRCLARDIVAETNQRVRRAGLFSRLKTRLAPRLFASLKTPSAS